MEEKFRSETFQPIATLVIPGTFAIAPYVILIVAKSQAIAAFFDKHEVTFGTVAVFAAIATGFLLEDLGSRIERHIWDPTHPQDLNTEGNWRRYLRTAYPIEPIGQRYLRRIVLRMKFELSFGLSLLALIGGLISLNLVAPFATWCSLAFFLLLALALAVYVFWESRQSTVLLATIRKNILEGVFLDPADRTRAT